MESESERGSDSQTAFLSFPVNNVVVGYGDDCRGGGQGGGERE